MNSRVFIFLFVLILIPFFALIAGLYTELTQPLFSDSTVLPFVIEPGETASAVAKKLKENGFLKNTFMFEGYLTLRRLEGKLKAGQYFLPRNLSLLELARALGYGKYLETEVVITIPEGWNIKEIASYLEAKKVVSAQDFVKATKKDFSQEFSFLKDKPSFTDLEGYLFPDTYRIFKNATAEDIIQKMLGNFSKKMDDELRKSIAKKGKSIFEIITLASIVEKEVPGKKDRPIVAGIFWKRLKIGMALQADSTVNYVTGKKSRALSSRELAVDSSYNTYKYPGLPPSPISNPGLEAIRATVFSQESAYWYFLSKEDGTTVFSKTLEEHVAAKKRWLRD